MVKSQAKHLRHDIKRDWQLYIFLLLPVAYLILFKYIPMGGLAIAFEKYKARTGIFGSKWVGFDNFTKFFTSYQFENILLNTLILSLYTVIADFPIPIIFALLLNSMKSNRFRRTVQTIVCLPHFISTTVMVGIVFQIFHNRTGLYGSIYMNLFGSYPKDIFGSVSTFRHLYVWSGVWQNFGWGSIIYIAALANVPPEYHEAAQIDGASKLKRIIHIDFPTIMPTIITMLILRMGSIMNLGFEKIYLMQNDLNISASEVISTYVYKVGLSAAGQSDFSYATAIGMFNSLINLILVVTVNKLSSKIGDVSLW